METDSCTGVQDLQGLRVNISKMMKIMISSERGQGRRGATLRQCFHPRSVLPV